MTPGGRRSHAKQNQPNHRPVCPMRSWPASTKRVRRVRGSRERFIRQCISGAAIREAPSVDVPKLIYEVRRVGASLNRTLIVANARGPAGSAGTPQGDWSGTGKLEARIVDAYTKD